jgi:hypothetical protein
MKQLLKQILASVFVISTASTAQAASFNFGYTFLSGHKVTGSFEGTVAADGNVVTGLSNISVFLDGVAFAGNGSLFGSHYNESGQWLSGGATASFDGAKSNFMFVDKDYPNDTSNYKNAFSLKSWTSPGAYPTVGVYVDGIHTYDGSINVGDHYLGYYSPRGWEMSYGRSVSAVPEPETYALMLAGLGLMGTIVRRRKVANAV